MEVRRARVEVRQEKRMTFSAMVPEPQSVEVPLTQNPLSSEEYTQLCHPLGISGHVNVMVLMFFVQ